MMKKHFIILYIVGFLFLAFTVYTNVQARLREEAEDQYVKPQETISPEIKNALTDYQEIILNLDGSYVIEIYSGSDPWQKPSFKRDSCTDYNIYLQRNGNVANLVLMDSLLYLRICHTGFPHRD